MTTRDDRDVGDQSAPQVGVAPYLAGQQLAEFMSYVAGQPDADRATASGVERAAKVIGAQLACIVRAGARPHCVGLPVERVDEFSALVGDEQNGRVELPGIGSLVVAHEPLDDTRAARLVVARPGSRGFSAEERDLLRGMAGVIGLAREMLTRRRLLERISEIQGRIVRRAAIDEIVELIVSGAAELTGSDIAFLRQAEGGADGPFKLQGCIGLSQETLEVIANSPGRPNGASRQVQRENKLIVIPDYQNRENSHPVMKAQGVTTLLAAPVQSGAEPTGALVVASRTAGRVYTESEVAALRTFAEQASTAMSDAALVADTVHRSLHDGLTGLPNRTLLNERLSAALARCEDTDGQLVVLFVDLDRFKTINDSLGHKVGDELLIAAAERLSACVGPNATPARLGGDEFAVLVERADERQGQRVAGRIIDEFERPFSIAGHELMLSASIGVAAGRHRDDDPLHDGDLAMYSAKTAGGGRSSVFRASMRADARYRLELETALRGATDRGELFLEYQPIVDLTADRIVVLEALLRWNHPQRGPLSPNAFLPLAERTRQIATLGTWVLRTVCHQAMAWHQRPGLNHPRVAVNVSAAHLHASDLVAEVVSALQDSGLPPSALVIELTETAVMTDVGYAAERLAELRRLGVAIAIDDFGTGYSSLQYLQRLPLDHLKIPRPFIAELRGPDPDLRMIRAIVALGHSWGVDVVAEGIESADQVDALLGVGCKLGQGFFLCRPQSAGALDAQLAAGRGWLGPGRFTSTNDRAA
ncbi:MAG: EAL domain-containing protein [Solirubrobacterales bacterium]|nr:EAL domain-containing protein [Solirubrobacterales bacterium]